MRSLRSKKKRSSSTASAKSKTKKVSATKSRSQTKTKAKTTKKKPKVKASAKREFHTSDPNVTEDKLIAPLNEDLQDAWSKIRRTLASFGEQRIYASHRSIMFARKTCYAFVRPHKSFLELIFFLARREDSPMLVKAVPVTKTKFGHQFKVVHADQVEAPLTDWLAEAFANSPAA